MSTERPWLRPSPSAGVIWDSSVPVTKAKRPASGWRQRVVSRPSTGVRRQGYASQRDLVQAESEGRLYYSTKYLGITGGEIGVLTVRRPIPVTARSSVHIMRDKSVKNITDSEQPQEIHTPEKSPSRPDPGQNSPLVVNPKLYDEFVVTKYMRPRPLTANKPGKSPVRPESSFHLQHFPSPSVSSLRFLTIDKRPVRPKSCVQLPKPSPYGLETPIIQRSPAFSNHPEAYIQYLLLKKKMRQGS